MNSTDPDLVLGALFDEVLMPIAQQLRACGAEPFPRAPDVSWLSYYVRRRHSAMTAADMRAPACASSAELATLLAAHWSMLGRRELVQQVDFFAHAANVARAASEAEQAVMPAPSPYVYAMF
jgi:hypothetical protein